jgi:hypothetical protein
MEGLVLLLAELLVAPLLAALAAFADLAVLGVRWSAWPTWFWAASCKTQGCRKTKAASSHRTPTCLNATRGGPSRHLRNATACPWDRYIPRWDGRDCAHRT